MSVRVYAVGDGSVLPWGTYPDLPTATTAVHDADEAWEDFLSEDEWPEDGDPFPLRTADGRRVWPEGTIPFAVDEDGTGHWYEDTDEWTRSADAWPAPSDLPVIPEGWGSETPQSC